MLCVYNLFLGMKDVSLRDVSRERDVSMRDREKEREREGEREREVRVKDASTKEERMKDVIRESERYEYDSELLGRREYERRE